MNITNILGTIAVTLLVVFAGSFLFPYAFADHVTAPLVVLGEPLFGASLRDVPSILAGRSHTLADQTIPVEFRGQTPSLRLGDLGVALDIPATTQVIQRESHRLTLTPRALVPEFRVNTTQLTAQTKKQFQSTIREPKNASLVISRNGNIQLVKSRAGEAIDTTSLVRDIRFALEGNTPHPLALQIVPAAAPVQNSEVERARALTQQLLEKGLTLTFEDKVFTIAATELPRLLEFVEQVDPQQPDNSILGVRLHPQRLRARLAQIAAELDQEPVNAKFEISQKEGEETRVEEFAAPQRGLTLNVESTAGKIAHAITIGDAQIPLAVDIQEPEIAADTDLKNLGIISLLARGESNFAGSPRNRIHNITVGTARYHGLLIPPGADFSFNEHLGPVNGAAGFKPELVIKAHATVPEFGGGLCQVSTTAFRAAVRSGLEIIERKNHSYAVRYYGKAGFDATIYPGYTDLRFRNNTPGHILIQTKIEGANLIFEFWGTPDGREVEVDGPSPYNRRPDGAVKATLVQRVKKDGQVSEKVFASSYKSPNLYPKVLAANAPQPSTQPTVSATPTPGPAQRSPQGEVGNP